MLFDSCFRSFALFKQVSGHDNKWGQCVAQIGAKVIKIQRVRYTEGVVIPINGDGEGMHNCKIF